MRILKSGERFFHLPSNAIWIVGKREHSTKRELRPKGIGFTEYIVGSHQYELRNETTNEILWVQDAVLTDQYKSGVWIAVVD